MHSKKFYISNLLVIFTVLFFESHHVPRLTESGILQCIQNLAGEIMSPQTADFDETSFPPETFLSTPEIIRLHGYPVETHKVRTEDGYIISIFRIIHTQKNHLDDDEAELKKRGKREPVLIQHGFICSSDDFLQLSPKDNLPYLLVDSGHNVWLGNWRGNTYGKERVDNITENDPKFYDFSADDASRDIPLMIKYILKVEKESQLSYVCHSAGCSFISMAVHEDPGLNKMIKKASFLAPAPYFSHVTSSAVLSLAYLPQVVLSTYSELFAGGRILPQDLSLAITKNAPAVCMRESTRHSGDSAINFLAGWNPGQITNETLVKVFGHFPSDTSMKMFVQFVQLFHSGNFQKFDYGPEKNLELYDSDKPPLYNLSRVVFPVQGIYGLSDNLVPPTDAWRTWSELGNVVETVQVEDEKWTHLDFLYGKDARKLVYEKIFQFLSE